jgi:hypothetical protein
MILHGTDVSSVPWRVAATSGPIAFLVIRELYKGREAIMSPGKEE